MMSRRRALLAVVVLALLPAGAPAQPAGAPAQPAGQVPPPPPAASPAPPAPRSGEVLTPPPAPDYERALTVAVERFQPVYASHGSPKIAVYWNRALTDRLSQWVADRRLVLTGQFAVMGERQGVGGDVSGKVAGSGEKTLSAERLERDPARPGGPSEPWGWEFESGFLDPLMRAGAQVVDRAAILRLTAAKTTGTGVGGAGMPDPQTIEIRALQGYADVLVEVLVSPAPQAPGGYLINATAKNVNNGILMAHVNSQQATRGSTTREYVATSRGFEMRERPPEVRRVASDLSLAVMDALGNYWRRTPPGK
jgi:hypothetical protein